MHIQKPRIHGPGTIVFKRAPTLAESLSHSGNEPFEETLRRVDAEGRVIASNLRLSSAFLCDEWKHLQPGIPCWSGTFVGYAAPDKSFGKTIEFENEKTNTRYIFRIPRPFRDEKNAIIVAEHPYYFLEKDGRNIVMHPLMAMVLNDFPSENGWYATDPRHGIPIGDPLSIDNLEASYLVRSEIFVGPVSRCVLLYIGGSRRCDLSIETEAKQGLGIIVECTEEEAAKAAAAATVNPQMPFGLL